MGRRGPVAQAAIAPVVALRRGDPGKRGVPATVKSKTPPGRPNPPSWLTREAKAEWNRVVPVLDKLGILAKVDRAVLAEYAEAWSTWVELNRKVRKEGLVKKDRDGNARKHPAWQMLREAAQLTLQCAKELGLTPNARLRMTPPDGDHGDGGDGILD